MKLISVKEQPEYQEAAIQYFQKRWGSEETNALYADAISHAVTSDSPLPQWYLLYKNQQIVGCAGLITNDFISRMDLYPWLCALYVEKAARGHNLSRLLVEQAKIDAEESGFKQLYLCTDHVGFYEKMGFSYIGDGYHPWGEKSRIYSVSLNEQNEELNIIYKD
ncbi:GNAT family N-acetyltransferase [Candidatus Enterococcus clewellii]|uniref:N-acetyltransferase domain-containing protein n=1 Tax=Candidatus Enterococcus clewellii TaxID=1834193 RepID=A0A242KCS5_9ENTE|nr:GNAT family N-acetyltransferase [Enterococcus sp. 9E7_DIV0242]OTP18588.1 hypothetical protein A5888_000402 [Enterococcus sp. 9E7_DIV0242]